MKKVTVSLPENVYRRARLKAAERRISVSALVREFLLSIGGEGSDFARRKRLQDEVLESIRTSPAVASLLARSRRARSARAKRRLTRDELHER